MATYRFNKETGKIEHKQDAYPSYVNFIPLPRNPSHGQHRRTSPKAHRDPSDRTSAGAGGTFVYTSLPPTSWRTLNSPALPLAPSPAAFASGGGRV